METGKRSRSYRPHVLRYVCSLSAVFGRQPISPSDVEARRLEAIGRDWKRLEAVPEEMTPSLVVTVGPCLVVWPGIESFNVPVRTAVV